MAHEIDLKKFEIHTDIVVEMYDKVIENKGLIHKEYNINNILIEETTIDSIGEKLLNKKKGNYRTITFNDITDSSNFKRVEKVFMDVLKKFLSLKKISFKDSCLVIGLGNSKSTPDSLGPLVVDNILVTSHLYKLGDVDKDYRNVSCFKPSVTGLTGIETVDVINSIVKTIKPSFLIVIDALSSSSIDRMNKTIQISDSGISPGSGIGNHRKEISEKTLNIPVISIGVPTVVDSNVIVVDTINKILESKDNKQLKQVLNNISITDYDLMVTVKEIDYLIEKLSLLISNGINKSLHKAYNTTKN